MSPKSHQHSPQPDKDDPKSINSPNLRPISQFTFERIEIEGKGQNRKNMDDLTSLPVLLDSSGRFKVIFRADNTIEIHTMDGKAAEVQVDESALAGSRFTLASMGKRGNVTTIKFRSNDSNATFTVLVSDGEKEEVRKPPQRQEPSTEFSQPDYNYPSRATSPWRDRKTISESHGGRSGE